MSQTQTVEQIRQFEAVDLYRQEHPDAESWAVGYGQIEHSPQTQQRVFAMAEVLHEKGCVKRSSPVGIRDRLFTILSALDRVTNAGMWLVVHQTYANKVYLDGRDLDPEDFKTKPEGHTGGSLNMVPAYAGYMGVNAITNFTRSWIMGQGHCVSGINSVQLLNKTTQILMAVIATILVVAALKATQPISMPLAVAFFITMGIIAFVLNYIPTLGSIIAIIPPTLVALLFNGVGRAIATLIGLATIQVIMGNFIDPSAQSESLQLSPFIALFSIAFWGWVWGIPGAILGVPMTISIVLLCQEFEATKGVAIVLGKGR